MLVAALELVLTCAAVAAQYSERGRCVPVEVARRRLRRAEVLAVLRLEQEVLAVHREPRLAAGSSVTTREQAEAVLHLEQEVLAVHREPRLAAGSLVTTRGQAEAVLHLEQEVLAVHHEPRLAAGSSVTTRGLVELVVRSSSVLSPVVGSSAMTREQRLLAAGRKLDRLPAAMACSVRGDWKPTRSATTPS